MSEGRATPMSAVPPPGHAPLILIIEDEEPIRRFLRATLAVNHFRVRESSTARDGLLQAVTAHPDLILLDLGLPDGDGLQVTQSVRTESAVPIVILSARGQESDKVAALDAGADDYLTKPFGVGELLARIRVALRHSALVGTRGGNGEMVPPKPYEATVDNRTLRVDTLARMVYMTEHGGSADAGSDRGSSQKTRHRREVRLTPMEFKLLAFLVKHAGKVLTHQMILKEVWGVQHVSDVQYLRVYAGEIRKKIEADSAQPRFLLTEPGVGYRLIEGG